MTPRRVSAPSGIVVVGAMGKMGLAVGQAAALRKIPVVGALERPGHPDKGARLVDLGFTSASKQALLADNVRELTGFGVGVVAIDFSTPAVLTVLLSQLQREKMPLVTGTTGRSKALDKKLRLAAKKIPILAAANFSPVVHALGLALRAALESLPADYKLEILEMHHQAKKDAPSGTALNLVDKVRSGNWGGRGKARIGVSSIRGGTLPGEHHVYLLGPGESLRMSHIAEGRQAYALGAVDCASFLKRKARGYFSMDDVSGV